MEENCRSVLQEYAIQLGLDMFACLISRLLRSATGLSEYRLRNVADSMREILPGLKAWSDWMTCHVQHWNPPPLSLDPGLGFVYFLCPNLDRKFRSSMFNVGSFIPSFSFNRPLWFFDHGIC